MKDSRLSELSLLDGLRLLASFVIVGHHMGGEPLMGIRFGVPLFLVIMFGLASRSTRAEPLTAYAKRKGLYLLTPWLRWSLFYIIVLGLADVLRGGEAFSRVEPEMLFYGGHPALWFLPFAAAALVPARGLQSLANQIAPARAALCLAGTAALLTIAVAWLIQFPMPDMPVRLWLKFVPAIFWGLAIGQSARAGKGRERSLLLMTVASSVILSGVLIEVAGLPTTQAHGFTVAVLLAALGFGLRTTLPPSIRRLSGTTFGVYLLHPIIGKALVTVADVASWNAVVHTSVVWLTSYFGVLILRSLGLPFHELGKRVVTSTHVATRPVALPHQLGPQVERPKKAA